MNKKIVLLLAALALVIISVLSFVNLSPALANFWATTRINSEPADPYAEQIKALQEELEDTSLSEETRKLEQEKLNTISMMATQRADGRVVQPTRPENEKSTPEGQIVGEKLPDGIDENPPIPFSEELVSVINAWRKTTKDGLYLVYSGYLTQDPTQGALLVLHSNTHDFHEYLTPTKNGGVKIIGNQENLIILQTEKGTLFYFDIVSEFFVNSDGEPIPTPTLSPTPPNGEVITPTVINPYP